MPPNHLTDAEIDVLSGQIDQQLRELTIAPPEAFRKNGSLDSRHALPEKQAQAIEAATGESVDHFWERFKRAAWKDLCQPDGLLYQQWQRWRDLNNKDVVRIFYGVLAGMGISGQVLPGLIVATAVIVLHLSVSAICNEG